MSAGSVNQPLNSLKGGNTASPASGPGSPLADSFRGDHEDVIRAGWRGDHRPAEPLGADAESGGLRGHCLRSSRQLVIEGQIGPFQARLGYVLEPVGDATRLTNVAELEPSSTISRLLAPLAASRVKAAVASNLETLKVILETDRQPTHPQTADRGNPTV
jgi:hypothetical protein